VKVPVPASKSWREEQGLTTGCSGQGQGADAWSPRGGGGAPPQTAMESNGNCYEH